MTVDGRILDGLQEAARSISSVTTARPAQQRNSEAHVRKSGPLLLLLVLSKDTTSGPAFHGSFPTDYRSRHTSPRRRKYDSIAKVSLTDPYNTVENGEDGVLVKYLGQHGTQPLGRRMAIWGGGLSWVSVLGAYRSESE